MSRKEVIKQLRLIKSTVYLGNRKFLDALEYAINYLNQPEPHWIPVTERLPKESGRYLVSVLDGVGRRTTVAPYQPKYKAWTLTGRMSYWKVIAWMPLPTPYEGRQE